MTEEEEYIFTLEKIGKDKEKEFIAVIEQKRLIEENPNPWLYYFEEKHILNDLENLLNILRCYDMNKIENVFFTAG